MRGNYKFVFFRGSISVPGASSTIGLWQVCFTLFSTSECQSISCSSQTSVSADCGLFYAARAFVTLACIISVILTIGAVMNLRSIENMNPTILKMTKFGAVICLALGIIGIALGIHETTGGAASWGAASYLAILSILINIGAAILTFMIR